VRVAIAVVVLALVGWPSAAMAQPGWGHGVVIEVGWQNGTLLLETVEGFTLLAVDPTAKIDDPVGLIHALGDFEPGDVVDYAAAAFNGMSIAVELHVVTASLCERGRKEPCPGKGGRSRSFE
jgi:hypothetical protein